MSALPDPFVVEAKQLLHDHLSHHTDFRVRAMNSLVELADDDPRVVEIAEKIRARAHKEN